MVSERLLYELEAVLLRPWFRRKLSYEEVLEYVVWLRSRGMLYEEGKIERIITDPDDDYLVALFGASGASVIVSGDRHLLDIGELRDSTGNVRLRAISPQQFLEEI